MKQYENPQIEVIHFSENDFAVLTETSGCPDDCPCDDTSCDTYDV